MEELGRANSQGTDGNRAFISWKEAKPNFIETQPSAIFDRFFTGVVAPSPTTDPAQVDTYGAYVRPRKKSLLDLTLSQSQALKGRLGSADKSRLELFETGFRELEKDLANLDTMQKPGATMGGSPTEVAQKVGYDSKNLGFNPTAQGPGGYYRFEKERAQAWARLWALLFGADKVRAGTHQITWAQSFLDLDNITGQANTTVHDVMHNAGGQGDGKGGDGGDPRPTLNWHVASLSTLASLLKELPEGAGSVLDNTAIVMVFDGGFGLDADIQQFAPGASGSHSTDNMVALVAGGAGGMAQGVHLKAPSGTQPAHVILNAMKSVGYSGNQFGKLTQVDIPGLKK